MRWCVPSLHMQVCFLTRPAGVCFWHPSDYSEPNYEGCCVQVMLEILNCQTVPFPRCGLLKTWCSEISLVMKHHVSFMKLQTLTVTELRWRLSFFFFFFLIVHKSRKLPVWIGIKYSDPGSAVEWFLLHLSQTFIMFLFLVSQSGNWNPAVSDGVKK